MNFMEIVGFFCMTLIVGSGITLGLLILYDNRKYPVCGLCGNNAHTARTRFFDNNFYCFKHGQRLDR